MNTGCNVSRAAADAESTRRGLAVEEGDAGLGVRVGGLRDGDQGIATALSTATAAETTRPRDNELRRLGGTAPTARRRRPMPDPAAGCPLPDP